jgi:hypothetical protein
LVYPERVEDVPLRRQIERGESASEAGGIEALQCEEFSALPSYEREGFRTLIEHNAAPLSGLYVPPARNWDAAIHWGCFSEEIADYHGEVAGAGVPAHLRELVGDLADLVLGRAALGRLLGEVGQCLNVEHGAYDRREMLVEPDRFIYRKRLEK